ncbi:MAG: M12 family metallopeptidase [Acidobacteriota bacterium]
MPKPTPQPRVCIDRVLPKDALRFQETRRVGRPAVLRAVAPIGKTWINGSTLRVRFLGGTAAERAIVKEQAGWWTQHANLKFDFNNAPDAEIRISFNKNDGAWSYLGTDAKGISQGEATMNLGFLDGGTVAHEFGHAIGLAHEHQNPDGGIQWNEPVVISSLGGSPNFWTPEQTRHNVLSKYTANQINGTKFDPDSIMLYFFPASWTLNGIATKQNEVLSETDKLFIKSARMYPPTGPIENKLLELKLGGSPLSADIGKPGEEDVFTFKVSTGGSYLVETQGATDRVMKLFGPNSPTNLIAEDDDSGAGSNARIRASLIAGQYFVQVRHWDPKKNGKYAVGVRKG